MKLIIENWRKYIAEDENPCWDGYEQIGMKEKDGKKVPNCVPIQQENENIELYEDYEEDLTDEESLLHF